MALNGLLGICQGMRAEVRSVFLVGRLWGGLELHVEGLCLISVANFCVEDQGVSGIISDASEEVSLQALT